MQRVLLERKTGVEPASNRFAVCTLPVRDHSHMAGVMRLEHTRHGFGDRCSTNWATPLYGTSDGSWTRTPSLAEDLKSPVSAIPPRAHIKLGTPALPILQAGQLPFWTTISKTLGRNKEVVAILLIVLLPLCTYWCRKAESNSYCAHTNYLHPALVMTKDSL